jgi:hypothetical protein
MPDPVILPGMRKKTAARVVFRRRPSLIRAYGESTRTLERTMTRFLKAIFGTTPTTRPAAPKARLGMETLEARELPAFILAVQGGPQPEPPTRPVTWSTIPLSGSQVRTWAAPPSGFAATTVPLNWSTVPLNWSTTAVSLPFGR